MGRLLVSLWFILFNLLALAIVLPLGQLHNILDFPLSIIPIVVAMVYGAFHVHVLLLLYEKNGS